MAIIISKILQTETLPDIANLVVIVAPKKRGAYKKQTENN